MVNPSTVTTCATFQHDPLDHNEPSIRLIRVLPYRSHDSLVQCHIMHTKLREASWVCISYTWGSKDARTAKTILLNGRHFLVRRNLFDFLSVLQSSLHHYANNFLSQMGYWIDDLFIGPQNDNLHVLSQMCYWIDALCIDQKNDVDRNHQVPQMEQIYSKEELVHIWLGVAENARHIRDV